MQGDDTEAEKEPVVEGVRGPCSGGGERPADDTQVSGVGVSQTQKARRWPVMSKKERAMT